MPVQRRSGYAWRPSNATGVAGATGTFHNVMSYTLDLALRDHTSVLHALQVYQATLMKKAYRGAAAKTQASAQISENVTVTAVATWCQRINA